MRNYLILDGVDSRDFGVYISGQGAFSAPSKAYSYQDVPGRNGAYIRSDKRFDNIEVTYPAFIYANFKTNISNFRNFLLSRECYVRLEDTYNTDEFRLASYTGAFEPEVTSINDAGRFDIVFNCMPQRFLKSGETSTTGTLRPGFGVYVSVTNPTRFAAKPLLKFTLNEADFKAQIRNDGYWEIESIGLYEAGFTTATLDCETMQAYSGNTNINKYIQIKDLNNNGTLFATDFPVLSPMRSTSIDGATGSGADYPNTIEVVPRWWRL